VEHQRKNPVPHHSAIRLNFKKRKNIRPARPDVQPLRITTTITGAFAAFETGVPMPIEPMAELASEPVVEKFRDNG
jgi:hypothetical protein